MALLKNLFKDPDEDILTGTEDEFYGPLIL